jgi:hypothetical protein
MNLSTLPFFAFLAPLMLFFQQTRDFLTKILRIFWKKRNLTYDLTLPFYQKLAAKSIVINLDDYKLKSISYFSGKYNKYIGLLIKMHSMEIFLYKYYIPIFIWAIGEGVIEINYLKFTFNFEKFITPILHDIIRNESNSKIDRFDIMERRGRSLKDIRSISNVPSQEKHGEPVTEGKSILSPYMILNAKLQNKVIGHNIYDITYSAPVQQSSYQFTNQGKYVLNQVEKWIEHSKWYQERNIPWRRGICLYGKPGNGKSSLILEVARTLKLPIYIYDLSTFDNKEFMDRTQEMGNQSGIVLFEDLDSVFDSRKNVTANSKYGGLTFDCLLNRLSGVNPIKNKFIFITTNNINKLDHAILRPGRMDEVIEILPLEIEAKYKLAERIIGDDTFLIKTIVNESENDSTAEFEKKCIDAALSNLWNQKTLEMNLNSLF